LCETVEGALNVFRDLPFSAASIGRSGARTAETKPETKPSKSRGTGNAVNSELPRLLEFADSSLGQIAELAICREP
jgi:hypothetical protein